VATRLEELLGQPVVFSSDTIGAQAKAASKLLEDGGVALIENLRFSPLETSSDQVEREEFAKSLAELGDGLVSDGFGVVHRKQASVYELAKLLPSYAGLLIEREVEVLRSLTESPERPYCVVLGGSKVSDKLAVIENLLPKVDKLLVGGGMVFTLLAAKGHDVASSLLESDQLETVRGFLAQADQLGVEILLPSDIVVANGFSKDAEYETVAADRIAESRFGVSGIGLDIGPESAKRFAEVVRSSKTVFWNGPMGVFEFENFSHGTKAVAHALTEIEGLSVVGGGDSASAVRALGFADDAFGHISTGGGASLEYLEGKKLPGLEVLDD
jgi:phosphoglycerate kinase